MSRLLPPTHLLRAFEACARHLSVSRAAEELHLTQSGVSRQLAQLEELVGVKLFFRVRRRLSLTPTGVDYAEEIRAALLHIRSATQALQAHQGVGGTLTIAVAPTFGTRWLMPRMQGFQRFRPRIMVNLLNYSAAQAPLDFEAEYIDAAIFAETTPWPGTIGHQLMAEDMVPVCAPALLADGQLASVGDLAGHTLLQHTTQPRAWQDWLKAHGGKGIDGMRGPEFQHMAMVAEAAAAGLGVALLPRFLIAEELASGRLALAFNVEPFTSRSYFLVHPDRQVGPALAAFRDWILKECAS